jgi:hypothetical protein
MSPVVSFVSLVRRLITLQITADLKPRCDEIVLRYTIVWNEALEQCGHDTIRLWYVVERGALQHARHLSGLPRRPTPQPSSGAYCRRCREPMGHAFQHFAGLCGLCAWKVTADVCAQCFTPVGQQDRGLSTSVGVLCTACLPHTAAVLAGVRPANDVIVPGRVQP